MLVEHVRLCGTCCTVKSRQTGMDMSLGPGKVVVS